VQMVLTRVSVVCGVNRC